MSFLRSLTLASIALFLLLARSIWAASLTDELLIRSEP